MSIGQDSPTKECLQEGVLTLDEIIVQGNFTICICMKQHESMELWR